MKGSDLNFLNRHCKTKNFSLDSAFSGGTGSKDNPYQIKSVADLNQLAFDVKNGKTYCGKFFKLMNDIDFSPLTAWDDDNSENNFIPIGKFCGTFDGNNHIISGIRIFGENNSSSGTKIKNITISNANIVGGSFIGGRFLV